MPDSLTSTSTQQICLERIDFKELDISYFEKSIVAYQNDLIEILKGNISSWRHSHFIGKLTQEYLINRSGFPYFSLKQQLLFIQENIEKNIFSNKKFTSQN